MIVKVVYLECFDNGNILLNCSSVVLEGLLLFLEMIIFWFGNNYTCNVESAYNHSFNCFDQTIPKLKKAKKNKIIISGHVIIFSMIP